MAKYCRYCGEREKNPRDKFCYKCRKSGAPVDVLFRYAKKNGISEEDEDIIRACGAELAGGAGALCMVPVFFLAFYFLLAAGDAADRGSAWLVAALFAVLAVLMFYVVFGLGLVMLDKRFVNRKWKISAIMFFFALFRSRRKGAAVISAAATAPRKIVREKALRAALTRLANGERAEKPAMPVPQSNSSAWTCGFCGYKNPAAAFECRSCGRIK